MLSGHHWRGPLPDPEPAPHLRGEHSQKPREEDDRIAYTWSHCINNTLEYDWLARMPMTKASIKAMDATQEFVKTLRRISPVKRFVVAGESKRGWTTWMVGGMNGPRVIGVVHIVAPVANLVPQINECGSLMEPGALLRTPTWRWG